MNLGLTKNVSPAIFDTDIGACSDIMSGFGAKGAVIGHFSVLVMEECIGHSYLK